MTGINVRYIDDVASADRIVDDRSQNLTPLRRPDQIVSRRRSPDNIDPCLHPGFHAGPLLSIVAGRSIDRLVKDLKNHMRIVGKARRYILPKSSHISVIDRVSVSNMMQINDAMNILVQQRLTAGLRIVL